jgi:hypothetical protein
VNLGRSANASRNTLNATATVRLGVNGVGESVCVYLEYAHPALSYVVENASATIRVNMDVADLMGLAGHLNARVHPALSYVVENAFALMAPVSALYPRVIAQVFVPCPRVIAQVFALYLGVTVQVFAISHMAVIKAAARDSEFFVRIT